MGGISERQREIRRRRHRKAKIEKLKRKIEKATVSEKKEIAAKVRSLTPGADEVIETLGLTER